mmetsp:Transcript_121349/g.348685  ORF Transcript_121349/g.348685 Transcript_121349/m.348685 type:complete len:228 (-) Transcript_121349:430-1113(-)
MESAGSPGRESAVESGRPPRHNTSGHGCPNMRAPRCDGHRRPAFRPRRRRSPVACAAWRAAPARRIRLPAWPLRPWRSGGASRAPRRPRRRPRPRPPQRRLPPVHWPTPRPAPRRCRRSSAPHDAGPRWPARRRPSLSSSAQPGGATTEGAHRRTGFASRRSGRTRAARGRWPGPSPSRGRSGRARNRTGRCRSWTLGGPPELGAPRKIPSGVPRPRCWKSTCAAFA